MIVNFKGTRFEAVPVSGHETSRVMSALRRGVLDHLGSLDTDLRSHCSAFQVYAAGPSLLAAAVSSGSQHIDVAYWLHTHKLVPV